MRQQTLAESAFERYREKMRRETFLTEMQRVVRWAALFALIEPLYPKSCGAGRPPVGVEHMVKIHFLHHWFSFSDSALEEALYDSRPMRAFVGWD